MTKIVDVHDTRRVRRKPDDVAIILDSGRLVQDGLLIRGIELRLYTEYVNGSGDGGHDVGRGPYSLITSYVETELGSIEMTYDEGFLGPNPLSSAARLLAENLGPSALVLRSVIELRAHLARDSGKGGDDGPAAAAADGDNSSHTQPSGGRPQAGNRLRS